jgi:predicted lipoprotein with Yx(FWY)xxD motif
VKKSAVAAALAAFLASAFLLVQPALSAEGGTEASAPLEKRFKPKKNVRIAGGDSPFGRMLYNGARQAIYVFDRDRRRKSRCYGSCATAWPPVLTRGRPKAVSGTRQRLLGVIRRKGGATQVTYRGRPLYYYAHEKPGQVFCHNVFLNGGLWQVIHPGGKPVS